MPANHLPDVLETTEAERLATGFIFTEGPLWHPDGYWYFVDLRRNQLLRMTPGKAPEVVRTTDGGNGTTFDLKGRVILCEGDGRRVTRMEADGKVEPVAETYKGGRFMDAQRAYQLGIVNEVVPEAELLEAAERRRVVKAAIVALPVDYREVIILRHFAELSYEEIAEALGL